MAAVEPRIKKIEPKCAWIVQH